MVDSSTEVAMLVDHELERISDSRVLAHIQKLRVEPMAVLRDWHYGEPGQQYTCWTVLEDDRSNIGIAYCENGFGPKCPWGLVSVAGSRRNMSIGLESESIGMDSEWFPRLLDAYFECHAADLAIWRVFKRKKSQPFSEPGIPITDEDSWDKTWKRIMALREKDPDSRYDCGHSIKVIRP